MITSPGLHIPMSDLPRPHTVFRSDDYSISWPCLQADFRPEPLITEADKSNDLRSLRRRTQGWLYLAVRGSDSSPWRLPATQVQLEGDSIRAGAERVIADTFQDSAEARIMGHAPVGHLEDRDRRTFFMLGVIIDGMPELHFGAQAADFAWLTREEVLQAYEGNSAAQDMFRILMVDEVTDAAETG